MGFWKENDVEPKRLFRFKIQLDTADGASTTGGAMWWGKSVKIPTFTSSPVEHQYLDNTYKFPGKVKWQDITITMVDPSNPDAVSQVMNLLEQSGFKVKDNGEYDTISKIKSTDEAISSLIITVIDADGNDIERWTVKHPMIVDSDLSTFNYDSDELREISMTIAYDWAECEILAGNRGATARSYIQ
jgi:hypothetical protein|tara:strand:- start:2498 stop:3058 length:561 start_codon:yes stop_codon:yes gene_type:complete